MDTRDKLEHIFELQKSFDQKISDSRNLSDFTMEEWVQKKILAIMAELTEVLEEVNYKWWKNPKEINMPDLKEELIDVLHFYISLCISVGMTPDEMYEIYKFKNNENHKRQNGTSQKKGYAISEFNIKE